MARERNKDQGVLSVGGLDEVGMGALAGPICVAAVLFSPWQKPMEGVTDSKKVSKKKRGELAPQIVEAATYVGIGWATNRFIDEHGKTAAWQSAAAQAVKKLPPCILIVDGIIKVDNLPENWGGEMRVEPKADLNYWQVGAASIVAKVSRDQDMAEAQSFYGYHYFWENNSGYGSEAHRQAILSYGVTGYHRKTFLKKLLKKGKITGGAGDVAGRTASRRWL
jgi:ribonuclease HII